LVSENSKKIFQSKNYELMVHDVRIVGGSFKDVSNLCTGHEYANVERKKNCLWSLCSANIRLLNTRLTKSIVWFQEYADSRVIVPQQIIMQFKTLYKHMFLLCDKEHL
jgi:hypothetical protein